MSIVYLKFMEALSNLNFTNAFFKWVETNQVVSFFSGMETSFHYQTPQFLNVDSLHESSQ